MSKNSAALRNVTEVLAPAVYSVSADWSGHATKLATDVVARASRQWLDFWFVNLNRAMDLWWESLRSRG